MAETKRLADEALAHSEDEGEWEDEPEQIESRPSGNQVISARLPTALAEELLSEAARRGVRPSELVRQAVEAFLRAAPGGVADISVYSVGMLRVFQPPEGQQSRTENYNLDFEVPAEPPQVIAVGFGSETP
jgi:hypothetical protein